MSYTLTAEYADLPSDTQTLGTFETLDEIATLVDKLDDAEEWPAGFDAVATDTETGARWLYASEWEAID